MASTALMRIRDFNDHTIPQRESDGYFYATAMCQATGKRWTHYRENDSTKEYIEALSTKTGKAASELIQTFRGGDTSEQGTWVHPYVAMDLATWCDPYFKIQVYEWVEEWQRSKSMVVATSPHNPAAEKIALLQSLVDLSHRAGIKVARNLSLAVEAITGEVAGVQVETLKERDLHYAEHFWSEKRKEGWRTHYATHDAMIRELGKQSSRIMRERGLTKMENLQAIPRLNRMADVGLYPWAILEEALRYLTARTKAYRLDKALSE